jgi:hypothetical protein
MYIITTSLITSGEELKRSNGEGGFALNLRLIRARYHCRTAPATWSDTAVAGDPNPGAGEVAKSTPALPMCV